MPDRCHGRIEEWSCITAWVSFQADDTIAEDYRDSKSLLVRHSVERYTLMALLGDLRHKTALDGAR
ncbi:MAG: hypothetical protein F4Y47_09805 [Acidobacteriia bacterium]|nr:hypothetical protein [Terriglobia bacterium]MYG04749.1 hypothetical protein [Terriglobia bacterium]MYK10115.1 hypothetical protein [Terriglobia bacterium]